MTETNKRPDFQETFQVNEREVLNKAEPHQLKIARHRKTVLSIVSGKISERLYELLHERTSLMANRLPDNSEIALYADLLQYLQFCQKSEFAMLPFSDTAFDGYLSHLLAIGRKRSTIDRQVASLAKWALMLELDDPRGSFRVKMRLLEIRKETKKRAKQAEGLRVEHLDRALELFSPDIPRDCQDITMLFVAFETLTRRSELVGFNWTDFEIQQKGTGFLHLDGSKGDQDGEGTYLYLSPSTTNLLLGWREISNKNNVSKPIFRGIYSDGAMGNRLSVNGVNRSFKRIAKRLGLEPSIFSGHSTRVGSAQEMIERNIDSAKIMLSGRWKSMTMLVRYGAKINAKRSGMADLTKILAKERRLALSPTVQGNNNGALDHDTNVYEINGGECQEELDAR